MATWLSGCTMRHSLLLIWTSLLVLLPSYLFADRIETKDGSIIYGKVIGALDGNLSFETSYSCIVQIPLKEVVSLSSSANISVRDEENNTIFGQSIPQPKNRLNLRNDSRSSNIAFSNVQHIWTEDSVDPWVMQAEEKKLELKQKVDEARKRLLDLVRPDQKPKLEEKYLELVDDKKEQEMIQIFRAEQRKKK